MPKRPSSIRLCIDCGEQIRDARMRAFPDATRCIFCDAKRQTELSSAKSRIKLPERPSSIRLCRDCGKQISETRIGAFPNATRCAFCDEKRQIELYGAKGRIKLPKRSSSIRLCIDCGEQITEARVKALPDTTRCVGCQSRLESSAPNSHVRKIDEGLAGTREGHKRMRGQQRGDMLKRNRE